jgi:predicted enzyme related to lactoylglutathione lyase
MTVDIRSPETRQEPTMDMKLELVPVPVTDVDRARAFYETVGFHVDVDVRPREGMRVVQLTPPGSACSIVIGTGLGEITDVPPGTVRGLHLVVDDIDRARDDLRRRGVDVAAIDDVGGGVRFARFADPDGNSLLLQQMDWRTGENF